MAHIPLEGYEISWIGRDQNFKQWNRIQNISASHAVQLYFALWNYSLVLFLCLSVLGCYVRAFPLGDKVWCISVYGPSSLSQLEWSAVHIWLCHFPTYSLDLSIAFMEKIKFLTTHKAFGDLKLFSSLDTCLWPPDYPIGTMVIYLKLTEQVTLLAFTPLHMWFPHSGYLSLSVTNISWLCFKI